MKRLLFGYAIFVTLQLNAQNYLISFEGKGVSKTVSTVNVENLTAGTSLTLNGSDILSLVFKNGVDPGWNNRSKLKIYPNPMVDHSTLEFSPPVAGDATITLCDINGKQIAQDHSYLGNFKQDYRLYGLKKGLYLINVVGHNYRFSGKLVSTGKSNGEISIEKINNNTQSVYEKQVNIDINKAQGKIGMDYSQGEVLRFTGFFRDYSSAVVDVPTSNKTIAFNFAGVPTIITSAISVTSPTTATSGGIVTADSGAAVTDRGVCWSLIDNPTAALSSKTSNGTGTGSFTSNITGLQPVTLYYVRAYATNAAGTAYGSDLTFTTLAAIPTITTAAASAITQTTAMSGGNITSNGGSAIISSGICWSTSHNPSIAGSYSSDGAGNDSFTSSMMGLLPNTLYYIRAYATNSLGTSYGNELSFTTNPIIIATLTTTVVSSITSATAVSGGNITDNGGPGITARGICWAITPSPTISDNLTSNGTGTGSFTSNITGLQPVTLYHVRAYATNAIGTAYGNEFTFITAADFPSLTTTPTSSVTRTTATSGGNITSNGGSEVTGSGICWSTSNNPSITGSYTSDGTANGSFTSSMTDLLPNTIYYIRAYASNSVGTSYGNELSFTTNPIIIATLTTTIVSSITSETAVSGGNITDDGGAIITARGICWGTSPSPTISDNLTSNQTGTGSFTSNITGLQPVTLYHVRAYATNSEGTAYGNEFTFTTAADFPSLTTTPASSVTRTTATSGGNITSNGGSAVIGSGICWSTSHNPSIAGSHTSDGAANGSFTSSMTGLLPNTLYYIRAYATNSLGTSYSNELSFTTNPIIIATLNTTVVSSITSVTAVSGGNITNNGGATITARGICWATSPSPTINDNLTSNGTGTGSFTSNITGLHPVTLYHVRAYATNSAGTAYGSDLIFTTLATVPTVTTAAVSTITETTATSGGNVTTNGGASITTRGVCWGTSANPTINNSKTADGTGTGSFTSHLTGLTPNTRYYVRAYATNVVGTAYGNEVTFMFIIPEINTCKWLRDASCFLNLSFDDTQAAHLKIANLLDVYGFKGTFYIQSVELEYQPNLIDDYKSILLSGHEVGSHTVNHLYLPSLSEQEMLYEIDSSVSRIERYLNTNCTSLAHPYHGTNDHINSVLFSHNLFTRDWSEYYTTRRPRFDLSSDVLVNDVTNFIDVQIANNNSCLIDGHGIDGSGYSPSTTEFFNQLFTYIANVQNNKKVWVTTISNGALYESLFNEVMLTSNIDQSNRQIKIHFNCPNKPIFNNFEELLYSFKINKSSSWSIQNSGIEYIETDTQYIFTIDLKQTRDMTLQYIVTN